MIDHLPLSESTLRELPMGKRFDAWVDEFESWGMTEAEAIEHAHDYYRSRAALALDELAEAIASTLPARAVRSFAAMVNTLAKRAGLN